MSTTQRLDWLKAVPGAYKAMLGLEKQIHGSGLERNLLLMVALRASQINKCAFCLDMHWKELRDMGEGEQRLYMLNAWRESPGCSYRERAALEWTEAVTHIENGVEDDVYRTAREHFDEVQLTNLTLAVVSINGWNRMNVAFLKEAGTSQLPAHAPVTQA